VHELIEHVLGDAAALAGQLARRCSMARIWRMISA
jgi:hypothetical protein